MEAGPGGAFARRRLAGADAKRPRSESDPPRRDAGCGGAAPRPLSPGLCLAALRKADEAQRCLLKSSESITGITQKDLEILAGEKYGD